MYAWSSLTEFKHNLYHLNKTKLYISRQEETDSADPGGIQTIWESWGTIMQIVKKISKLPE